MLHVVQWSVVCVLSLEDRKFNLFWFCFVVWFFSCWGPIRVTCQGGLWSQVLFAFYQSPSHLPSFFANSRKLKSYLRRSTTWENNCKQRNRKLRKYLETKKLKNEKISANRENEFQKVIWEALSANKEIGVSHVDERPRSMNHMCPVLFRRSLYLFLPPRCRGDHYLDWNYSFIRSSLQLGLQNPKWPVFMIKNMTKRALQDFLLADLS